jgi:hypothetical protein
MVEVHVGHDHVAYLLRLPATPGQHLPDPLDAGLDAGLDDRHLVTGLQQIARRHFSPQQTAVYRDHATFVLACHNAQGHVQVVSESGKVRSESYRHQSRKSHS